MREQGSPGKVAAVPEGKQLQQVEVEPEAGSHREVAVAEVLVEAEMGRELGEGHSELEHLQEEEASIKHSSIAG